MTQEEDLAKKSFILVHRPDRFLSLQCTQLVRLCSGMPIRSAARVVSIPSVHSCRTGHDERNCIMAEKIFSASVGKLGKHKDSQDLRRRFLVTAMARKARDAVPRTRRARVDEEPGERDKFILPALNLVEAAVEDVWPQESLRRVSGNSSRTDASDSTYQTGAVPDPADQLRSPKDTVELPSAVREAFLANVTALNSTEEGSSHRVPADDELRPPLAVKRPRTMEPGKEPCEAQCAPLDAAANFQDTQDMDTS